MDGATLAFVVIAFLIGLVVKDYLPSYARKKGENLATKEDIAAITAEVESVKAAVGHRSHLLNKKQELLMYFYDEITTLHFERLAVNFMDFPNDDGKSLYEYQMQFYKSVAEVTKAYQRLIIFLPRGSGLLKASEAITKCILETRKVMAKNFDRIKITDRMERRAYSSGVEKQILQAAEQSNIANSQFWNQMRPHAESFRSHYEEFLRLMNEYVTDN